MDRRHFLAATATTATVALTTSAPAELPEDQQSRLDYPIAYGEAARLAEMARPDHGWDKAYVALIAGEAGTIEKDVIRRRSPRSQPGDCEGGGHGRAGAAKIAVVRMWTVGVGSGPWQTGRVWRRKGGNVGRANFARRRGFITPRPESGSTPSAELHTPGVQPRHH